MTSNNGLAKLASKISEDGETRGEAVRVVQDLMDVVSFTAGLSSNSKIIKALTVGSSALTLGTAAHSVWRFYRKASVPKTYTIKITEDDAIFEIVEDWFMEALPQEKQLSIYAHSTVNRGSDGTPKRRRRGSGLASIEDALNAMNPETNEDGHVDISYSFDGTIVQTLEIADHHVDVYTNTPEHYGDRMNGQAKKSATSARSINIVCKTVEARNAVLNEIEEQSQFLAQSQPTMYVSSRWGDFRKRSHIQTRSRESVILKEGQMDRILGYLHNFQDNKEAYIKADIPFRTGILLYGEPGSGKSSTALAIANEMKMNVYVISLSGLTGDEALGDCFASIPANSIIILEDIDIVSAVKSRDKDDDENGVTMAGMLNVLDGFQSPPGVITIMTTNRLEVLDDAIIRPGRVDLKENLDCLDDFQLKGLCNYFMEMVPENLPTITPAHKITSADVVGIIRKHIPDFAEAENDLVRFVENKVLTPLEV